MTTSEERDLIPEEEVRVLVSWVHAMEADANAKNETIKELQGKLSEALRLQEMHKSLAKGAREDAALYLTQIRGMKEAIRWLGRGLAEGNSEQA